MGSAQQLRKEILAKVSRYHKATSKNGTFAPGKDYVNYAGRVYDEKELSALVDSSLDFWLTSGRYAQEFEKRLANFIGAKFCLLTNSGSSANLLAVTALTSPLLEKRRLRPGDEVITTACGFPTTLNPIIQNGAVPVFVDIEPGSYNIDVSRLKKAVTRKTRAIVLAHTLGNPVDIAGVQRICEQHKLWYIEDNCDALGSKYGGRFTGTFGHIATCSFYPAHHITMGEGGALLTSDPLLRRIILSFRDWGRDCWCEPGRDNTCGRRFDGQFGKLPRGYDHKYVYSHIGYNLKVTDMQAAIGCAQLDKLPGFIRERKKNFAFLRRALSKHEEYLSLPRAAEGTDPSWFGFTIMVKPDAPFSRADIVAYLENNKVATRMLFGGNLIKQPAYLGITYKVAGALENTDLVMNNLFWIGVYPGIGREKREYIAGVFDSFFKKYGAR